MQLDLNESNIDNNIIKNTQINYIKIPLQNRITITNNSICNCIFLT